MLIYNNIRRIAKLKKIRIEDLAELADMTRTGFTQSLDNGTLKVNALVKISEGLKIPITAFFDKNPETSLSDAQINYVGNSKGSVNQSISTGEQKCQKELQKAKEEISELRAEIILLMKGKKGK